MIFYIERRTMTKWRKDGDDFYPLGPWLISRTPEDVRQSGLFTGPYQTREEEKNASI